MEGSLTRNPNLTHCVEGTITLALCILHGGEGTFTPTLTYTHNVARTLSNAQGSSKHCLTAPHYAFYWPEWNEKMHFSSKIILQLRKNIFFRAHAIEEALRKDRYSAEKGTESTKKGEGEQQHKEKLSPLPFELIINAAQ